MSNVRVITPDPIPTLTARWGDATQTARQRVQALTDSLRELDQLRDQLACHGLTVSTDLGPIGNSAAAARRDLEKDVGEKFRMPEIARSVAEQVTA